MYSSGNIEPKLDTVLGGTNDLLNDRSLHLLESPQQHVQLNGMNLVDFCRKINSEDVQFDKTLPWGKPGGMIFAAGT